MVIPVKSDYKCSVIYELTLNNDIAESIIIEVSLNSRNFAVGSCFRPHTVTYYELSSNLKVKDCIVCEDFNVDLLKKKLLFNCKILRFYTGLSTFASTS